MKIQTTIDLQKKLTVVVISLSFIVGYCSCSPLPEKNEVEYPVQIEKPSIKKICIFEDGRS